MDIRYHHLYAFRDLKAKDTALIFAKNMANVKKRYNNEKITLVEHCDEICSHCPNNKGGKCKEEEKVKSYDKKVKKLISLGIKPTPNDVAATANGIIYVKIFINC